MKPTTTTTCAQCHDTFIHARMVTQPQTNSLLRDRDHNCARLHPAPRTTHPWPLHPRRSLEIMHTLPVPVFLPHPASSLVRVLVRRGRCDHHFMIDMVQLS